MADKKKVALRIEYKNSSGSYLVMASVSRFAEFARDFEDIFSAHNGWMLRTGIELDYVEFQFFSADRKRETFHKVYSVAAVRKQLDIAIKWLFNDNIDRLNHDTTLDDLVLVEEG